MFKVIVLVSVCSMSIHSHPLSTEPANNKNQVKVRDHSAINSNNNHKTFNVDGFNAFNMIGRTAKLRNYNDQLEKSTKPTKPTKTTTTPKPRNSGSPILTQSTGWGPGKWKKRSYVILTECLIKLWFRSLKLFSMKPCHACYRAKPRKKFQKFSAVYFWVSWRADVKMAINTAKCLKIETAGLLIGWTYFLAFGIGFLSILTASLIGIYLYIAGEWIAMEIEWK